MFRHDYHPGIHSTYACPEGKHSALTPVTNLIHCVDTDPNGCCCGAVPAQTPGRLHLPRSPCFSETGDGVLVVDPTPCILTATEAAPFSAQDQVPLLEWLPAPQTRFQHRHRLLRRTHCGSTSYTSAIE